MERFVRVQGSYAGYEVLTKEGYDELKQKISERFERLESLIEVLSQKTEKRLWKARSVCVYKTLPIPHTTDYTDMMELTVDEAVSWYNEWAEHLNDYTSDEFTVYANGLFYKKDGEWIRYRIGGNNER